ncbi:hypothetical protein ES706_04885 [subsurface metagenome]
MAEKDEGKAAQTIVLGSMAALAGTALGMLLAAKPVKAAPDEKLDYLLQLLEQLAQGNVTIIGLLEQLVTAAGIPGVPGVEVTVLTPWVAKEPEVLFDRAITSAATFDADKMVNWTRGKRLVIKVESLLDQDCDIQVVGNITDSYYLAIDINDVIPCPAHGNTSIGLAWDDWMPFIGVRITTAVAPTPGSILTISAVIQE